MDFEELTNVADLNLVREWLYIGHSSPKCLNIAGDESRCEASRHVEHSFMVCCDSCKDVGLN